MNVSNRAERRRKERTKDKEVTKLRRVFSKLSDNEFMLVQNIAETKVNEILEESSYLLDMIYSAKLSDLGYTWDEAERFNNEVTEAFQTESSQIQELKVKLGKGFEEEMTKISFEVEKRVRELLENEVSRKDAIKTLMFEYPALTKSMLTNAYSKIKKEYQSEDLKNGEREEDSDVHEAAEKIMEIIEGEDTMAKTEVKKVSGKEDKLSQEVKEVVPVVEKSKETDKEPTKDSEQSKLKVLSMVIEGENGTYKVCNEGVELTNNGLIMAFKSVDAFDKFIDEFKQVFAMIKA